MPDTTTFGAVPINTKFTIAGSDKIWIKIKPISRGCCRRKKIIANAVNSTLASEKKVFAIKQEITVVQ